MFKIKSKSVVTAIKCAAILVPALSFCNTAQSLTAVIEFQGKPKAVNMPITVRNKKAVRKVVRGERFTGQVVIRDFESFASFNREIRKWEFTTDTLDAAQSPNIGIELTAARLGGIEGTPGRIRNLGFDYSLPACSARDIERELCDVLNPEVLSLNQGVNFGELNGAADVEFVDGAINSIHYEVNREVLAGYDVGLADNIPGLGINRVSIFLSKFKFIGQKGEYVYFKAKSRDSAVELIDVELPAPATAE